MASGKLTNHLQSGVAYSLLPILILQLLIKNTLNTFLAAFQITRSSGQILFRNWATDNKASKIDFATLGIYEVFI